MVKTTTTRGSFFQKNCLDGSPCPFGGCQEGVCAKEIEELAPAPVETRSHSFWLRPDYECVIELPVGITEEEADRICVFIALIVS